MTANPSYNLTWGDYGTSLISTVQLLRCQDELVDVTLAAGGKTFHAHKVVLCAASPFLLDLLKSTTCKHPVVMLAGVQASDLEALLEFVYRGEVSVESSQLPSLLQAAHCLNIQGLASGQAVNTLDTKIGVNKVQELNEQTVEAVHEEECIIRRKKRAKRLRSPTSQSQHAKWSKVFVQTDGDNVLVDSAEHLSPSWTQHMNLVNVATTSALTNLPLQTPILVQNVPVSISNSSQSSPPKIRGASDQPGSCPLCGAMLRQARNLRRHLITSCKYRSLGSSPNLTASVQHIERTSNGTLHQLQTIPLHNVERVTQNIERIDSKQMALTPISCGDLLPSTSSIITMQSTLQ